ncbi:MAG: U32 family peptidase C-terminal domain-containing protein [Candidatus Roizmanbacteria bacterium]|nr:U32 family peptidase C-terminal domain-containing protein [Candidatus Roizmanbacteria bacterium]
MADKKVGTVSHYYNHLGVAIIEVKFSFSVGDTLKFVKHGSGEEIFQQTVSSIQEEHKQLEKAAKGQSVGIKVDNIVHEGVEVYRI